MQMISIAAEAAGTTHDPYTLLEEGNILLLPQSPFLPSAADAEFLRAQQQAGSGRHKNIAYKPAQGRITGSDAAEEERKRMTAILSAYSEGALTFLRALLPDYAGAWREDYASYRPFEEAGRPLPLRHRNDLLHLDAFPTRPTHGGRILRLFTNLHPTRERVWACADSFEALASRYAVAAGLRQVTGPGAAATRLGARLARLVGARVPDRSPYDAFMLRFHHYLKSSAEFQQNGRLYTFAFPAGASWLSFTDQVAHAVVSGQYALEQTCIVPHEALARPELSTLSVLERIAGQRLVSHERPTALLRDSPGGA
jgi:hypothetical protein